MATRKTLAQASSAGVLFVAGQVINTGGTLTLSPIARSELFTGDVTVTDGGVGLPSIVVTNFLGASGIAIPVISCASGTAMVSVASATYSGETLTVACAIQLGSTSVAFDSNLYFQIFAF